MADQAAPADETVDETMDETVDSASAGETHAEVGHAEGGTLPQLDFSTYAPQLFWLAVSFVVLYLLMARVALPRIATVLEERRDKIADDLDKAQALKGQADDALKAYETALAGARQRAGAIAQEMRDKLKAQTDAVRTDLEAKLARDAADAEARIRRTKEASLGNLRSVSDDVAGLVVQRLLDESADPAAVAAAVDRELTKR